MEDIKLHPWQEENVGFIEKHKFTLIADEMGLGKTLISSAEGADSCSAVRVALTAASIVDSSDPAAVVVRSIDTATVASMSVVACETTVGDTAADVQPTNAVTRIKALSTKEEGRNDMACGVRKFAGGVIEFS